MIRKLQESLIEFFKDEPLMILEVKRWAFCVIIGVS